MSKSLTIRDLLFWQTINEALWDAIAISSLKKIKEDLESVEDLQRMQVVLGVVEDIMSELDENSTRIPRDLKWNTKDDHEL